MKQTDSCQRGQGWEDWMKEERRNSSKDIYTKPIDTGNSVMTARRNEGQGLGRGLQREGNGTYIIVSIIKISK